MMQLVVFLSFFFLSPELIVLPSAKIAVPLLGAALVPRGVLLHLRVLLLGVKVLTDAGVMDGLQALVVFHLEVSLLILEVHHLKIQMLM